MRRALLFSAVAVAATLAVTTPAQAEPTCAWSWDYLPLPAGATYAQVDAADGDGVFAGTAGAPWPAKTEAVRWQGGTATSLGAAFGADTRVLDVNEHGEVVGQAGWQPVVHRDGQWERLPVPSGSQGAALNINDNGDIVGAIGFARPILWPASGGYQLLPVPSPKYAEPAGIADDGTVIVWTSETGSTGRTIGYLRAPDGTWTLADDATPGQDNRLVALNEDIVVGGSNSVAAEWDRDGNVIRTYSGLSVTDVNDEGQLLGATHQGDNGIWRAGVQEVQFPQHDGVTVWPKAIDDAGAVAGQWEAPGGAGPYRPVVGSCA
jgi:hypothetical protein